MRPKVHQVHLDDLHEVTLKLVHFVVTQPGWKPDEWIRREPIIVAAREIYRAYGFTPPDSQIRAVVIPDLQAKGHLEVRDRGLTIRVTRPGVEKVKLLQFPSPAKEILETWWQASGRESLI